MPALFDFYSGIDLHNSRAKRMLLHSISTDGALDTEGQIAYNSAAVGSNGKRITFRDDSVTESVPRRSQTETISGVWTFSEPPSFSKAIGTNPFTVTSTTKVTNLNADKLDDYDAASTASANTIALRTSGGQLAVATPSADDDAVPLAYLNTAIAGVASQVAPEKGGVNFPNQIRAATTANFASTYDGGLMTLTATSAGALSIDGISDFLVDEVVLVKNQTDGKQNGPYYVLVVGDGATAAVLKRDPLYNQSAEFKPGMFAFVEEGTANAHSGWALTTSAPITLDTTVMTWGKRSDPVDWTAGRGMVFSGTSVNAVQSASYAYASGARVVISASDTALGFTAVNATATNKFLRQVSSGVPAFEQAAAADLSNGVTGSGAVVLATSPSLTTPTLGVAAATSINKVAITAPATAATLTIAEGKTFTSSNTITLTATDGSTLAIGTGGTLGTAAYTAATAYMPSGYPGSGLVKSTGSAWGTSITDNSSNWNTAYSDTSAATSANTASTIVKRDVSGNFSAGTISAALTGTASKATNLVGGNNTTLLGSMPYQSNTDVTTLLAPNTTTTRNFLRMTGDGVNGAVPAWDTVTKTDVGLSAVENTALSTWAGTTNITTAGTLAVTTLTVGPVATHDRIIVSPIAKGAGQFDLTLSTVDLTDARAINFPNVSGTIITTGDTGTVTNTMLAGSIAVSKLADATACSVLGRSANSAGAYADIATSTNGHYLCRSGDVVQFKQIAYSEISGPPTLTHEMLSATHTDSTVGTVARGDLITGQSVTPKWTRLAKGTAGQIFYSDGTDLGWITPAAGQGNGITLSYLLGQWTVGAAQNLASTGSPTFKALTLTQDTANVSVIASTGSSVTGANSTNLLDLATTWNTSGAPTGFKLTVTNTASGASALLLDLLIGAGTPSSVFSVSKAGTITTASNTLVTNLNADLLDGQHGSYYASAGSISGTLNKIAKFSSTTAVGDSSITDNGTTVAFTLPATLTNADAYWTLTETGGATLKLKGGTTAGYVYMSSNHPLYLGGNTEAAVVSITGTSLVVGSSMFTVAAASGNTTIAGTLGVGGQMTVDVGATPAVSQIRARANSLGVASMACYSAGNGFFGLDCEFGTSGDIYARHTSAVGVYKISDRLDLFADASLTVGNAFTRTPRLSIACATGLVTIANGLTVTAGGAAITGNSSVTGTLNVTSTLSVATDKFSVTSAGDVTVAKDIYCKGNNATNAFYLTADGAAGGFYVRNVGTSTGMRFYATDADAAGVLALTIAANSGAVHVANGLTVTAGGLTVTAGGQNIGGTLGSLVPSTVSTDVFGGYGRIIGISNSATTAGKLKLCTSSTDGTPFVEALVIEDTGAATFSSTLSSGAITAPSLTGTSTTLSVTAPNGNLTLATTTTGHIILNPASTYNVGIGTTGPGTNLHVAGDNHALNAGYNDYGNLYITTTGTQAIDKGGALTFGGATQNDGTQIYSFGKIHGKKETASVGSLAGYLAFETGNDSVAPYSAERMRINSLGNVGFGITDPLAKGHFDITAIGTGVPTLAQGVLIGNSTAATEVAGQQNSPRLTLRGTAWNEAASDSFQFGQYAAPQADASIYGFMYWQSSVGGVTWVDQMRLDSSSARLSLNWPNSGGTRALKYVPVVHVQTGVNPIAGDTAVTHNLNTSRVMVWLRDVTTGSFGTTGYVATDANTVTLTFDADPGTNFDVYVMAFPA